MIMSNTFLCEEKPTIDTIREISMIWVRLQEHEDRITLSDACWVI